MEWFSKPVQQAVAASASVSGDKFGGFMHNNTNKQRELRANPIRRDRPDWRSLRGNPKVQVIESPFV